MHQIPNRPMSFLTRTIHREVDRDDHPATASMCACFRMPTAHCVPSCQRVECVYPIYLPLLRCLSILDPRHCKRRQQSQHFEEDQQPVPQLYYSITDQRTNIVEFLERGFSDTANKQLISYVIGQDAQPRLQIGNQILNYAIAEQTKISTIPSSDRCVCKQLVTLTVLTFC